MKPKPPPTDYEIRYIKDYGEIGAGSVVKFVSRENAVPVIVPVGSPDNEFLGRMTVRGISLEDEDIYDGDFLIFRRDITKRDIGPHTLCAVFVHSTGDLIAKKVLYGNKADYVTLRASGGGIEDIYYPADEIEIRGIVFLMQRGLDMNGRFRRRRSPDDIPF